MTVIELSTHVGRVTDRDDYVTPGELWSGVQLFYQLDTDCAASAENAKCSRFYSAQDSFLTAHNELDQRRCWLNPPFSMKEDFLAHVVAVRNIASIFVCLVPNSARETEWWQDSVWPHADEIISLTPRVNFILDGVLVKGVAFPSCLVVYRPRLPNVFYGTPREIIWRWKPE